MNTARSSSGAAALNGKIYVCGGSDSDGFLLNSVEVYDSKSDRYGISFFFFFLIIFCTIKQCISNFSWSYVASMRKKRLGLFVASFAGKLWAIGGINSESNLSSVEVYNPEIDTWSKTKTPLTSIKGPVEGTTFSSKHFYRN